MKKKVLELYIKKSDNGSEIWVEYMNDVYTLAEKLGILEWAKAVVIRTTEIENALSAYDKDET